MDLLYQLMSVRKMQYQPPGNWRRRSGTWRDRSRPQELVDEPDPEPTLFPSRDFRINESHRIGQGSLQQKARDNIAAIAP